MSNITEVASGQINGTAITIELVEADETPAVVIVRWPAKPSVLHPHRFPGAADTACPYLSGWRSIPGHFKIWPTAHATPSSARPSSRPGSDSSARHR
jgi:hypothetical protein